MDPDGASLRRAARKAKRRRLSLTLVQGYADRLPAEDASLDHVVSSLALHHIDDEGRVAFAQDALRALRPGGKVTIADLGGPTPNAHDARARRPRPRLGPRPAAPAALMRSRVAQNPSVARNLGNGIVALLADAGFPDAREVDHIDHRFGRVTLVQATRP